MGRYIDASCRLCRREKQKLFLKGTKCFTEKCPVERRGYPPGQHGQARVKHSDYGIQLREKQKVKRIYGLLESQFRNTFALAARRKGVTGEMLLQLLERRLDNVVVRLGFANSHNEGRQLVRHGHFTVNGKKVNVPSYEVYEGDVITVREKSRKVARINEALEAVERRGIPGWLNLDKAAYSGTVKTLPSRADTTMPINEHLIVELYSK